MHRRNNDAIRSGKTCFFIISPLIAFPFVILIHSAPFFNPGKSVPYGLWLPVVINSLIFPDGFITLNQLISFFILLSEIDFVVFPGPREKLERDFGYITTFRVEKVKVI